MKIKHLELDHFRCFKEHSVDFGAHYTDIYGANGMGKTTIANAICWLLIDRPATEETEFSPKTGEAKGMHHGASITIIADGGEEITFKKDFYEKYTKKKGVAEAEYTGNAIDYYIDGVKTKKKDYIDAVERACHIVQDKMKMLLVLKYFADTMKTEDKRKILFEMATDYTDEDIFTQKPNLQGLREYLKIPGAVNKYYSIPDFLSIAKERRKNLNKDLEMLPIRIDELSKMNPTDKANADEVKGTIAQIEQKIDTLKAEKARAITPEGQQTETAKKIAAAELALTEKRMDFLNENANTKTVINESLNTVKTQLNNFQNELRNSQEYIKRAENLKAELTAAREKLKNEYATTMQEKWDASMEICPTCGQNLPPEKAEKLRAEFNCKKSEKLEAINRRGQECSAAKIAQLDEELKERAEGINSLKTEIANAIKRRDNLNEALSTLPTFESTDEYKELAAKIEQLKQQQQSSTDNTDGKEAATEYDEKIQAEEETLNAERMKLAEIMAAERNNKRIKELEDELHAAANDLERIEKGIFLAEEFNRAKAGMISKSINKNFQKAQFVLFREQINGGMKEICEPFCVDSTGRLTEYKSLNYAEQVNVQIDIVTTLAKHYGVNLPVIMDQGESVITPAETDGQRIRLIVSASDYKELRVVNRD